jgi:Cdc6-like AAA superfamily ATPase
MADAESTLASVSPDESSAYYAPEVDQLLVRLEEATRARPEGAVEFVPPAGGELSQAEAGFHHLVYGRRGSGKTSLLRYLERQLRSDGRVTVWIDEELFMALSFPDVLVSSVLEVMRGRPVGARARQPDDSGARLAAPRAS